jgi:hypothetical protein
MKQILIAAFVMLSAANAAAETKKTQLALNWEPMPTGANETAKALARIPGAVIVYVRDIEQYSTDTVSLLSDNGAFCRTMVRSAESLFLNCGSLDSFYSVSRVGGPIELFRIEEVDPAPTEEAPPARPSPPKKAPVKQKSAPYTPGWSPKTHA